MVGRNITYLLGKERGKRAGFIRLGGAGGGSTPPATPRVFMGFFQQAELNLAYQQIDGGMLRQHVVRFIGL